MSSSTSGAGRRAGKFDVETCGATRIGRATALAFAHHGAKVSILDIQEEEGEKTAQMVRNTGGETKFTRSMSPKHKTSTTRLTRWLRPLAPIIFCSTRGHDHCEVVVRNHRGRI